MIPPPVIGRSDAYNNAGYMDNPYGMHGASEGVAGGCYPPPGNNCGYYMQPHRFANTNANNNQHQHQHPGRRPPPPMPQGHRNYATIGCFSQNVNGWAGVPLISTAASAIRRPRKFSGTAVTHSNVASPALSPSAYNSKTPIDESPLSRLAVHAHGAPLILAGRYRNPSQRPTKPHQHQLSPQKLNGGYHPMPCEAKAMVDNGENCQSTIVVGEEDKNGGADTCLPRIIKPRKRRKKDRKPPPSTTAVSAVVVPTNASYSRTHYAAGSGAISNFQSPNASVNALAVQLDLQKESTTSNGTCYCRLCDPSRRIWAFPLRRTSSNISTHSVESSPEAGGIAADFGAIGSNRSANGKTLSSKTATYDDDWTNRSSPFLARNGSFSDSSDSGCADISSGSSLIDLMLENNLQRPLGVDRTNSTTSCDSGCSSFKGLDIDFPTAESLLTESINEISKKLMETCDLRTGVPGAPSSDGSSVFSDSGIGSANLTKMFGDESLIFNFENLRSDWPEPQQMDNAAAAANLITSDFVAFHRSSNGNDNELFANCYDMALQTERSAAMTMANQPTTIGIR